MARPSLCKQRVTRGEQGRTGFSADGPRVARRLCSGIDPAGRFLSESSGGEAASSGGSDLQVVAPFPKPVEYFAVPGGEGHVEVGSRFGGGQVEDGVDQSGLRSDGQVAGLDMEVGVD